MRTLKNSKINKGKGVSEDAADRAALRAQTIDDAVAGAADTPRGEGTTPLTEAERAAAKERLT